MKLNITSFCSLLALVLVIGCGPAESGNAGDSSSMAVTVSDDVKSDIEDRLDSYLEKTNNKEWSASFDYLHPIIFDMVSKDEMINAFEQMDATGFTILVESADITNYENLVTWESTSYTQFSYDCDLQIKLAGEQFSDPMMIEMMDAQMRSQYGEDKVEYDSTSQTFDILAERSVWAITGDDENWYFVEETPQLDMVLDQIVPDTVQTILGL